MRTPGNGEAHFIGTDGTTFCAPHMIGHYVTERGYVPPPEFRRCPHGPAAFRLEQDCRASLRCSARGLPRVGVARRRCDGPVQLAGPLCARRVGADGPGWGSGGGFRHVDRNFSGGSLGEGRQHRRRDLQSLLERGRGRRTRDREIDCRIAAREGLWALYQEYTTGRCLRGSSSTWTTTGSASRISPPS